MIKEIIFGISLFTIFQILIERVLKPQIEWVRTRSALSEALLTYRQDIIEQSLSKHAAHYIHSKSAKLYSHAGLLPWKQQISLNINRQINLLLAPTLTETRLSSERIYESLKILRQCRVRSSYTGKLHEDSSRYDLTGEIYNGLVKTQTFNN